MRSILTLPCRSSLSKGLVFSLFAAVLFTVQAGISARAAASYSVLHTFNSYADGSTPTNGQLLLASDGNYYGTTQSGGTNLDGTIYRLTPEGELTTLRSGIENGSYGGGFYGRLVEDSAGELCGAAAQGGKDGYGVIYKMRKDGTAYTVLYSFGFPPDGADPEQLTLSGNTLYGICNGDGENYYGTIFSISTAGTNYKVLHSFSYDADGSPAFAYPLAISGSTLYGCNSTGGPSGRGTLYKLSTNGATFKVLYSFGAANDVYGYYTGGVVVGPNHVVYGNCTQGGAYGHGLIWGYNLLKNKMNVVHAFLGGSDGANPGFAPLLVGSTIYGTTQDANETNNGTTGSGTIFSLDTSTGALTTIYTFDPNYTQGFNGNWGLELTSSGDLIGARQQGGSNVGNVYAGTIFKYNIASKAFSLLYDFSSQPFYDALTPYAPLIEGPDNRLHGTTSARLIGTGGDIYSIGLGGTDYSIDGSADGDVTAGLTFDSSGNYFGVTTNGGSNSQGSLFEAAAGGDFADRFSFSEVSGYDPREAPITGSDGLIYGTTIDGGEFYNDGVIYRFDPAHGKLTVLYSFTGGADGSQPYGSLFQGSDGNFYGTTFAGGANKDGTVFMFSTATSTLTTLHAFSGADGESPNFGVIEGSDGRLYGTTSLGGANSKGVVYGMSTSGTNFRTLYSFGSKSGGMDGETPSSTVAQLSNGKLCGVAEYGGAHGEGVVYDLSTTGAAYTVLHSFAGNGIDGANPYGGVTEGTDGNLYGATINSGIAPFPGVDISGTIWEIESGLPVGK